MYDTYMYTLGDTVIKFNNFSISIKYKTITNYLLTLLIFVYGLHQFVINLPSVGGNC